MRLADADRPGKEKPLVDRGKFLREFHCKPNGLSLHWVGRLITIEMATQIAPWNADLVERICAARLLLPLALPCALSGNDLHAGAKTFRTNRRIISLRTACCLV